MTAATLQQTGLVPISLLRFAWSVRREVWEHRFLIAAPLGVAVLALIGFLVGWPFGIGTAVAQTPRGPWGGIGRAYDATAFFCMITGFVAALFYCLDALHGERRDRSILFWKSLPVSDFQTVLAKLAMPMLVLPLIVFVAVMIASVAMLLASSAILAIGGHSVAMLWSAGSPGIRFSCVLYALTLSALWYAPIYGALLLISVWARHAPFLWAVLPPALLAAVAEFVFHAHVVRDFYAYRLLGWFEEGLRLDHAGLPIARDPQRFFMSPGLWLGLAVAAIFFTSAVRLRRNSSPL
jgi:ABC-2 type transport system permease protein